MVKSYTIAWITALICVALSGVPVAAAQSPDSARRFLEDVYAEYDVVGPDMAWEGEKAIAAPELLQDIKKLWKILIQLGDSSPSQESDPICNCQDWDNIKVTKIDIKLLPNKMAEAKVFFTNTGFPFERGFILQWDKYKGRWLIYDIKMPEWTPPTSLHKLIQQEIREFEKQTEGSEREGMD
jgi:hypothetical protein